jgi:hypothetical protein
MVSTKPQETKIKRNERIKRVKKVKKTSTELVKVQVSNYMP